MASVTCSKHLALPPCLVTFLLALNLWRAPPSVHLLAILAPSLPFFFLEDVEVPDPQVLMSLKGSAWELRLIWEL